MPTPRWYTPIMNASNRSTVSRIPDGTNRPYSSATTNATANAASTPRLRHQVGDAIALKSLPFLAAQPLHGPGNHEHAKSPAFLQQPLIHQHRHAFEHGGRIDGVRTGDFRGAGHLFAFGESARSDARTQLVGHLHEQRLRTGEIKVHAFTSNDRDSSAQLNWLVT